MPWIRYAQNFIPVGGEDDGILNGRNLRPDRTALQPDDVPVYGEGAGWVNLPDGQKGELDAQGNIVRVTQGPASDTGNPYSDIMEGLVKPTAPIWSAALASGALAGSLGGGVADAAGNFSYGAAEPSYSYMAQAGGAAPGSVSSTVTPVGGEPDAIGRVADLTRGNDLTATQAAQRAGYGSTEAYLKSIDPSMLSAAGTAAAAGGAAASGGGWNGGGASSGGSSMPTVGSWLTPAAVAGSALLGTNAAREASNLQAGATDRATQAAERAAAEAIGEQRRQFDLNRSDLAPYREAGTSALSSLRTLLDSGSLTRRFTLDDFWSDPVTKASYQSGLDLGREAINNMAGARGNKNSGATLKALTKYGTDYTGGQAAGSEARFTGAQDREFSKYSTVAGIGQGATNTGVNAGSSMANNVGNIGVNTAGRVGDLVTAGANARGAAAIGGSNAVTGAASTLANWYSGQENLDKILAAQQRRNY